MSTRTAKNDATSSKFDEEQLIIHYNDDDINNANEQYSLSSPSISTNETNTAESAESLRESSNSNLCGVDWSDRARPTSHCWFTLMADDPTNPGSCIYDGCQISKRATKSKLVKCESCLLVIHEEHLNNINQPCKPSFTDETKKCKFDQHFWVNVTSLAGPCDHCQDASTKSPYTDILRSTVELSNGFVCVWCSKSYHKSCWETKSQDKPTECDYGLFRDIIVRPQWLYRSRDSPIGFQARAQSNDFPYTPVIFFINKRSGGQVGEKIYRTLLQKLNPRQIFLLENNSSITNALKTYALLPNIRICVCGGDGTVGWVLARLAETYRTTGNPPPVAICPLGTGNDLSRVLAWGEQYEPKRLLQTLLEISKAKIVPLDRWEVKIEQLSQPITPTSTRTQVFGVDLTPLVQSLSVNPKFVSETNRNLYPKYQELPNSHFINYMSFGLDAAVALDFHDQRTRNPSKFSSPWKNKLMYVNQTCKYLNDITRANMWDLRPYIRLICDGQDLTEYMRNCHTLIMLNIPGYASGTNPWDGKILAKPLSSTSDDENQLEFTTGNFSQQSFGDRKIEIVGLSTTRMATIHVGFRGKKIAQCHTVRIELLRPMTAQIDGEPFYLADSIAVNINHGDQVCVLKS